MLLHTHVSTSQILELSPTHQSSNRRQKIAYPLSQPQPQRNDESRKPIEGSIASNNGNADDEQQDQLYNYVIVTKNSKPIVYPLPQSLPFVEDQDSCCNSTLLSVSSLSSDESANFFPDPASVEQIDLLGKKKMNEIIELPLQISPSRILASASQQPTFPGSRKRKKLSAESSTKKKSTRYAVNSRRHELQYEDAKNLDGEEEIVRRHSTRHCEDSVIKSLEPEYPPPYIYQTTSTTPTTKWTPARSKIRHNHTHSAMFHKYNNRSNNSSKKSTPNKPALLRTHRKSYSSVSLTNTSMSSSQYEQSVRRGSHSITSVTTNAIHASVHQSPIIVSGREVNDIKHRMRPTIALGLVGELESTGLDDHDCSFISNAEIMGKLVESEPTPLNLESVKVSPLPKLSKDKLIQSTKTRRKRKRKRRTLKDELKYLIAKLIPSSIRGGVNVVLKRKSYDLQRSCGRLT